ncbi:MAG: hypothetical protein GYB53_14675 [Rhodobacteraceae bacterium]|nr:hypothetical protein [Paracoccaceae bacterium]MBR9819713.1 hypothetical protein [Paracoccaceae bacterium]
MSNELHLDVRGSGRSWAVFNGAERVSPHFSCEYTAVGAATRLEKQSRQRQRVCLCCRDRFISSGPGNRLCSPCRRDPARAL